MLDGLIRSRGLTVLADLSATVFVVAPLSSILIATYKHGSQFEWTNGLQVNEFTPRTVKAQLGNRPHVAHERSE